MASHTVEQTSDTTQHAVLSPPPMVAYLKDFNQRGRGP